MKEVVQNNQQNFEPHAEATDDALAYFQNNPYHDPYGERLMPLLNRNMPTCKSTEVSKMRLLLMFPMTMNVFSQIKADQLLLSRQLRCLDYHISHQSYQTINIEC